LLDALDWLPARSVIAHGGLDFARAHVALEHHRTAAVAFGNPNHETELAACGFRASWQAAGARTRLRTIRLP
jgi:hypothetical protein